jgi:hypothetical protein
MYGTTNIKFIHRQMEDNNRIYLQEVGCGVWTGLSWLRIETGGRHL